VIFKKAVLAQLQHRADTAFLNITKRARRTNLS